MPVNMSTPMYFNYQQVVRRSSPVAYWTLDEASGLPQDSSENSNHADVINAITQGSDPAIAIGKSVEMPATSNARVEVPEDSTINDLFVTGGSLEAWIYARSDGENNNGRIAVKTGGGTGWLAHVEGEVASEVDIAFLTYFTTSGVVKWKTTNKVTINEWHHFVLTYDGSSDTNNPIFYIDGSSVAITETLTPSGTIIGDGTQKLYIGNRAGFSRDWDGFIDEVALYDRVLPASEVLIHYNAA